MTDSATIVKRSVSWRSIALALLVGALAAFISSYHDGSITRREVSQHNYVAPLVLALMFLIVLGNAFVHWLRPRWSLGPGELGVVLALSLISAPLPRFVVANWVGTMGYTTSLLESRDSSVRRLQNANVYEVLPEEAMLDQQASRQFDDGVVATMGDFASPQQIPWSDWSGAMRFWALPVLSFLMLSIALAYTLYKQWAERELLLFPLAEFASGLLRNDHQGRFPDVFYKRSFWVAFVSIVTIFVMKGIHAHATNMIDPPTSFSFYALADSFSFLKNSHEGYSILRGWMFFTVIAVAVLLPAEISFTCWTSWLAMIVGSYIYYLNSGQKFGGGDASMVMSGAFWAMSGVILYTGRRYYIALLRRAVGMGDRGEDVSTQSVWVFRCFLLSLVAFVVALCRFGIALDIALLFTLSLLVMLVVFCRLVAEMGIPWTPLPGTGPLVFIMNTLGSTAIGAKLYSLLAILTTVILPSRGTVLLVAPMTINALHVETQLSGRQRTIRIVGPFIFVALCVSLVIALWLGYSSEGEANGYHTALGIGEVNQAAANIRADVVREVGSAEADAAFASRLTADVSFADRWSGFSPAPRFPVLFGVGVMLVLVTAGLRLRFPRLPIHPLPLVLFGSWLLSRYFFSFLIGWLIKKALLKVGGARLFESSKPFFTGMIVGQAVVLAGWVLVNIVLYRSHDFTLDGKLWSWFRAIYSW